MQRYSQMSTNTDLSSPAFTAHYIFFIFVPLALDFLESKDGNPKQLIDDYLELV
jgi:hypothetical protein